MHIFYLKLSFCGKHASKFNRKNEPLSVIVASMEPTSSLNRGERKKGSSLVTGSEVQSQASGASFFITTDSEKSLVSRQASQVEQIELRTYVFLDSLQPQLAAYMGTVSRGFLPIPGDSCLWMEVSPGMAVHRVTDIALKASNVRLGQMIVERAFGSLALYHKDQSTVLHSGDVVLDAIAVSYTHLTLPTICSV